MEDNVQAWLEARRGHVSVSVTPIPLSQMDGWCFDEGGNLRHETGRFFSIEGIRVSAESNGKGLQWEQPVINQPEVGYLGIIAKEFGGVLHFLMQAKVEPGNINAVQLSPTLQATKSNYTRQHKGAAPRYLEYFLKARPEHILIDQLQSEQGARFLKKKNRNIVIRIDEELPLYEDFAWISLPQIKDCLRQSNLVNMDTRSVIAGINIAEFSPDIFGFTRLSATGKDMYRSLAMRTGKYTMKQVLSWLAARKAECDLSVVQIPLRDVSDWRIRESEISRDDGKYFKVIGCKVEISNREVVSWCQPLVRPMQQGLCAFVIRKIDGVYHFLVQAKLECGNIDAVELAPTVQCLTGNVYENKVKPPFADIVLQNDGGEKGIRNVLYDSFQSEEGGRFFHEQNRNMIVEVGESFPLEVPESYIWMTLGQLYDFLRFNNFLNIQARSLLAAIPFI